MKVLQILVMVLLLPGLAFAYKVVLKNGKVIEGSLVREDDTSIFIESSGIQMNFKKDTLDIDKMKELNPAIRVAPVSKTAPVKAQTATAQTNPSKKPARVFTDQDVAAMKEVWEEQSATQTSPAATGEPPAENADPQTAAAQPVETQTEPAEPEIRDEKAIRSEIAAKKQEIAELEKRIADLKSQGKVTATWEKLLEKQKAAIASLQSELKEAIAAAKAAKTSEQ